MNGLRVVVAALAAAVVAAAAHRRGGGKADAGRRLNGMGVNPGNRVDRQALLASLVNESRKIDDSTQPRSVARLSQVSTAVPHGAARLGYQALRWPRVTSGTTVSTA